MTMVVTLHDKVTLVPVLSLCLGKALIAAAKGPFRAKDGTPTYKDYIVNALVRGLCVHFTYGHYLIVLPTYVNSYNKWCHKHKIKPDIVDIPNTNAQGFWIGSKETAKYQMVFYHGGGFVVPGTDQHIKMLLNFVKWSDGKLAVFCVCYTLAPEAIYPTQLGEAVEGLRYALSLPDRDPSNTLIGGDSAGGNLAIAVISHISGHQHPNTEIVKPLDVKSDLKGAVAIAPWVSSDKERYPSMRRDDRDIINNIASQYWINLYKGGANIPDDFYITNSHAPAEWWQDSKVEYVLCTGGEQEVLLDSIIDWAEKYREAMGGDRIRMAIGAKETHDAPLDCLPESRIDRMGESCQEGAIRAWIKLHLL